MLESFHFLSNLTDFEIVDKIQYDQIFCMVKTAGVTPFKVSNFVLNLSTSNTFFEKKGTLILGALLKV